MSIFGQSNAPFARSFRSDEDGGGWRQKQNTQSATHALHRGGGASASMGDKYQERARWIERNLLPQEPRVRSWLSQNRIRHLDADDIIQEMYARIGSLDNLDSIRDPALYAIKVAHSILANQIRRSQIVSITAAGDLSDYEIPSPEASPEDELVQRDEVQVVVDALATLPKRTRDVLLLRRVEGLSQKETARTLDIAEKTVEKHMTRALLYLATQFGRGGRRAAGAASNDDGSDDGASDE
jgi:RNA polymerase sigma factor, sigma-70 family